MSLDHLSSSLKFARKKIINAAKDLYDNEIESGEYYIDNPCQLSDEDKDKLIDTLPRGLYFEGNGILVVLP